MASIYINLHDDEGTPAVDVLTIQHTGERFMNITITNACTITLPGRDHATACYAFALADAIRTAAEELKAALLDAEAEPVEAV